MVRCGPLCVILLSRSSVSHSCCLLISSTLGSSSVCSACSTSQIPPRDAATLAAVSLAHLFFIKGRSGHSGAETEIARLSVRLPRAPRRANQRSAGCFTQPQSPPGHAARPPFECNWFAHMGLAVLVEILINGAQVGLRVPAEILIKGRLIQVVMVSK